MKHGEDATKKGGTQSDKAQNTYFPSPLSTSKPTHTSSTASPAIQDTPNHPTTTTATTSKGTDIVNSGGNYKLPTQNDGLLSFQLSSVSGKYTSLVLTELKIAFDLGCTLPKAGGCNTVFFTHGHLDHVSGIGRHLCERNLNGIKQPVTYVVPTETMAQAMRKVISGFLEMSGADNEVDVRVLRMGEEWVHPKYGVRVRAFPTKHRVQSQGYAVWGPNEEWRPENPKRAKFISELRAKVGEGERALIAYTGDTMIDAVDENEVVRNAHMLFLECTYVGNAKGDSVEKAKKWGHIHLDEIAQRAESFKNDKVFLMQFSKKYRADEIQSEIDRKLPLFLRERVWPCLYEHSKWRTE